MVLHLGSTVVKWKADGVSLVIIIPVSVLAI